MPELTTLKPGSLAITILAAVLLFRTKWTVLRTIGVCALIGLAAGIVEAIAG